MGFRLPELNFPYDALEPSIDAKTMEIHHSKHHNGYTNNLNNAIKDTDLDSVSIEDILTNLDMSNKALRNNAGGYYNHKLFWEVISPINNNGISPEFLELINNSFGSMEEFSSQFSKAAATQFGSGWAWLCAVPDGSLKVCATANQDNPLMPGIGCGGTPILGVDVWEHAYYLNYQNRRVDYISAFIDLINWEVVHSNYTNR
ncbi:MAG: superoxide dismutase [Flavobacteriaceae bacterium]|nr:superoxide dismutase [Flavobacteriaceae bacterium]